MSEENLFTEVQVQESETQIEVVKDLVAEIQAQLQGAKTQLKVFNLLSDQQWHCRKCEGKQVASEQYAGVGIKFWYEGSENWSSVHQRSAEAEEGCIGCGWYNFEVWRDSLNQKLSKSAQDG